MAVEDISSEKPANHSFYTHGNNSTSSTLRFGKSNNKSQVSSVGFYTLKKTNTNSSVSSSNSTSTTKINPLTKLFTRNRSNSNFNLNQGFSTSNSSIRDEESIKNAEDDTPKAGDLKRISSGKFRLSNKLKMTSKNYSSKPDLTIQTGGQSSLKIPKKILSANQKEEKHNSHRRNSVSSPVSTIHNFFRNYNAPAGPSDGKASNSFKDELNSPQKLVSNNTKLTITLSSSNSNSYITDPELASVFNFTVPDYSAEYIETAADNKLLHDLHKMMLPADQYIQAKLYKSHQNDSHGLTKLDNENEIKENQINQIDDTKNNEEFFDELIYLIGPILKPSQNVKVANKFKHPHLGRSMESISKFVSDNYLNDLSTDLIEKAPNKSPSKHIKAKFKTKNSYDNFAHILNNKKGHEKMNDLKSRQILEELSVFFNQCITVFHRDYFSSLNRGQSSDPKSSVTDFKDWLRTSWQNMCEMWIYFNTHIRFRLLNMFYDLEKILNETRKNETKHYQITTNIEIESLLLSSYREIIIMPMLVERDNYFELYEAFDMSDSTSPSTSETLKDFEIHQLVSSNGKKLNTIKNSFGVINSQANDDYLRADNKVWNSRLFLKTLEWLQTL